jgi:hypothetical protein
MKAKNIVTAILLLFVAASVVWLVVKGQPQGSQPDEVVEPISDGVIVYYFHSNARCPTCKNIEAYAHEAVQTGFVEPLDAGQMQWRVLNYEQPANEHCVAEYGLVAPTVILVEMDGGKEKQWKNLARVWELVGDKPAFIEYVQGETRTLLNGAGSSPNSLETMGSG